MRFRVLGPLEFFDGTCWTGLPSAKQRSLLAFLLIHADQVVTPDRLVEELWGQRAPRSAPNLVQQYVMRLRRLLGQTPAGPVVTRPGGYALVLTDADELDAGRFTRLLADGQRWLRAGEPERAAAVLTEALRLWRGDALADVAATPTVVAEAARLEEQRMIALETRIDADLACGRETGLVAELRKLVRDQPMRERLWGQLMLALYRTGRQADALAAYREVRQLLDAELAIEPGAALAHLHQRILNGDPGLWRPPGPPGRSGAA
jgi:DNA-binding SARP family transcriptional activator